MRRKENNSLALGVSSGCSLGLLWGLVFHNLALGLLLGISIGLAGALVNKKK